MKKLFKKIDRELSLIDKIYTWLIEKEMNLKNYEDELKVNRAAIDEKIAEIEVERSKIQEYL